MESRACPNCGGELSVMGKKEHYHTGGHDTYTTYLCHECGYTITVMNGKPSYWVSGTVIDQDYDLIAQTGSSTISTEYNWSEEHVTKSANDNRVSDHASN